MSIALEAWTLSMVGSGKSPHSFSNSKAVENLALTAKRVLSSMLHEPRALAVVGSNPQTPKSASSSFYSDQPPPPQSEPLIDARAPNNQTVCVRARTFKLAGSSVRVTVCLYRATPIVDIRRWNNGVVEPTFKPVVMTAREYFGFSNQHDSIARKIHAFENRRISREQDVGQPSRPATLDDSAVKNETTFTR